VKDDVNDPVHHGHDGDAGEEGKSGQHRGDGLRVLLRKVLCSDRDDLAPEKKEKGTRVGSADSLFPLKDSPLTSIEATASECSFENYSEATGMTSPLKKREGDTSGISGQFVSPF